MRYENFRGLLLLPSVMCEVFSTIMFNDMTECCISFAIAIGFSEVVNHTNYLSFTVNLVVSRKTDRRDFTSSILEHHGSRDASDTQLAAHASDSVIVRPRVLRKFAKGNSKLIHRTTARWTQHLRFHFATPGLLLREIPTHITHPCLFALPPSSPKRRRCRRWVFLAGGGLMFTKVASCVALLALHWTVVSTNPLAASLDDSNFPDALHFMPERWIGQDKESILEASQPLSLGPRGCIGRTERISV